MIVLKVLCADTVTYWPAEAPPVHVEPQVATVSPDVVGHPQNWLGAGEALIPE